MLVLQAASARNDPARLPIRQDEPVLGIECPVRGTRAIESSMNGGSFIRMHAAADQVAR